MPERDVSRRVARISPSPTMAVDARAKELKAAGEPVIGFGAGEPDFPTPEHIVAAAERACRERAYHRYTPTAGLPELRAAIADKTRRDSGLEVSPDQVLVTNGGKHALYGAFMTICDPGDEVLLPAPYWVSYPEQAALAGAEVVTVPTDAASGYRVTVEQLEKARTARTRALVFVSPSNPTGAVYPPDEVAAIGHWAAENGIWVVTDEIYEHLVYGDARFTSLPAVVPEAAARCLVINGVAKTYAMTGWRVGWLIGPAQVIAAATALQSHMTSNVANVAQAAALAALTGSHDTVYEMRAAFDRRRLTMVKMLRDIDGVDCPEPEGAFYCFPDVRRLLGRAIAGRTVRSSAELAEVLLDAAKVAVVPGEAFGAPGHIRLSYALGDDELAEGVARIADVLG